MARLGRYFLPDQKLHFIQRGNNRGAIFFGDDDDGAYRDWLREAAEAHGRAVHAYVLMTNHVQLLLTPQRAEERAAHAAIVGPALRPPRQRGPRADRDGAASARRSLVEVAGACAGHAMPWCRKRFRLVTASAKAHVGSGRDPVKQTVSDRLEGEAARLQTDANPVYAVGVTVRSRRRVIASAPSSNASTPSVPGSGTSVGGGGGGGVTATGAVALTEPVPASNSLPARGPETR